MPVPVEMALVGAGHRGYHSYGPFARHNPHLMRWVAVAEPDPGRRERFATEHGIRRSAASPRGRTCLPGRSSPRRW